MSFCCSICVFPELEMKEREDELSSTVSELRNNVSSLEDKFAKEESDKLVGL